MTDDLDAIRARWAGVAWHLEIERQDGLATNAVVYDDLNRVVLDHDRPGDMESDVLLLAAHAPADIQALLSALDTASAALAGQSATNADLLRRLAAAEAEATLLRTSHADAWTLIGRCDMAFELIEEAKLLGVAKKTAKQLRAEIRKASGQ